MPSRPLVTFALAAVVTSVLSAPLTGCRDAATTLGATPASARTHADELFRGLAIRFVNVQRTPKFEKGRAKLARYALSPSRLMGDTNVWTSNPTPASRLLELEGWSTSTGYLFTPRAGARAPARTGDSRHTMQLAQLDPDEFRWSTLVEHAVGPVSPAEAASGFSAWLAAFEQPEHELRADIRQYLPRTSAALGRLFVLDSVRSTKLGDGSHLVELRILVDGKRVRPTMPALADYVDKYVRPGRYVIQLGDGRGARFMDARMGSSALTFRFRTRDGRLLALDGPARPLPDSATLEVAAFEKFFIFDVGVSQMAGDFVMVRAPRERGWAMRFHQAPRWHLPLAVRHLISGPLDRPFQREGIIFSLVLRNDGSQTLLVRQLDVSVKESAIVRWLGGLGSHAMEDFSGRAEIDENRFTAEALLALRADIAAALGGSSSGS